MTFTVHMPILSVAPSKPKKKFIGIDKYMCNPQDAEKIASWGVHYVTIGNFLWSEIEPIQGKYNFKKIDEYRKIIINIQNHGMEVLCCIHGVPNWARYRDTYTTDKFSEFKETFGVLSDNLNSVTNWQIFNEVDSHLGYLEHYGGWGNEHTGKYLRVLRSIQEYRKTGKKLSVSLMMDDGFNWHFLFKNLGGESLVDYINFHFYPHWYVGYTQKNLSNDLDKLASKIDTLQSLFTVPLRLTETNLLNKTGITDEYNNFKSEWLYKSAELCYTKGLDGYLAYSYRSGWHNADIYNTPSETTFINICRRYNK